MASAYESCKGHGHPAVQVAQNLTGHAIQLEKPAYMLQRYTAFDDFGVIQGRQRPGR